MTRVRCTGLGQCSGMTPEGRVPLGQLRVWLDHLRNDPAVLADLAVADESEAFVRRESAVIEKARRNGACILWIALHPPAAEIRDQVERTCERGGPWLAFIAEDPDGDEPPEVATYCPPCADRELPAR